MTPLFHTTTKLAIDDFIRSPSHALLITGPTGSGKGTTAKFIASQILGIDQEKLKDHPYVLWFHDQEKSVSIDSIRSAQTFVQLKTPGIAAIRRVLIVEQGETMSIEAQNAFLKLLEEPPADTLIIITSNIVEQLLPTIRSRTQTLRILPPSQIQTEEYFGAVYPSSAILKAYFTSEGYAGLMQALLQEDADHPLVELISIAKTLLAASTFERVARIDELTKIKNTSQLLQAMERVCHAALIQAVNSDNPNAERWSKRLKAVLNSREQLTHNAQQKLLLTNLMLSL